MDDPIARLSDRLQTIFPAVLGLRFLEAAPDRVRAAVTVRPDLCTSGGVMHGGALMTLADTLGGVATILNLPPDGRTITVESKTNFLAAAAVGTDVTATTTPLHRGRTTMVWETRITTPEGRLVALTIQTQLILSPS